MLFIFGIYTNVGLMIGQATFPTISALPGFIILIPFFYQRILSPKLYAVLLLPAVFMFLTLFSPETSGGFVKRLTASGQATYSLILGILLYAYIASHSRDQIARFLKFALPIYISILALEVLTPLKGFAIEYMNVYQYTAYDYTVANRDIGIAGGHRPKFLTSETSYVAMTLTFAIGIYTWTMRGNAKYLMALIYCVVGLAVVRSPILLAAPLLVAVDYSAQFWRDMALRRISLIAAPIAVLVVAVSFSGVLNLAQPFFEARLRGIQSGQDYSTTYRTYGSYIAGIQVANKYPIGGVGIGTQDIAAPIVQSVFVSNGVPIVAVAKDWKISLANAFAYSLIIFGYAGSIIVFSLALIWTKKVSGALDPVFLTLALTLSLTYGAVYTPKYICHWMLFAAVSQVVVSSRRLNLAPLKARVARQAQQLKSQQTNPT